MNGWIKRFADNSLETGSDDDVMRRISSWRRGRLDGIVGVELHHDNTNLYIDGTGEFWQSDDYEVLMLKSEPELVKRRIQKKIHDNDIYMHVSSMAGIKVVSFLDWSKRLEGGTDEIKKITEDLIGKWFTLEYHLKTKGVMMSFRENRI